MCTQPRRDRVGSHCLKCHKQTDDVELCISPVYRRLAVAKFLPRDAMHPSTSHGHVSVRVCLCLSVTSRCYTKTAKRRITETTPHNTTGTLVFCCQRSPRNSTGVTPYGGARCRWGGSKLLTFDK